MAKNHSVITSLCHKGHYLAHLSYLGLVSIEAHGMYGGAAAVLLLFTLLLSALGVEDVG